MPRDFLLKIAASEFPARFEEPYDVQCVQVLRAAELVDADITPPDAQGQEAAVVFRITPMGRAEIERASRRPG